MNKEDRRMMKRIEKIMKGHYCRRCPIKNAACAGLAAATESFMKWKNKGKARPTVGNEGGE